MLSASLISLKKNLTDIEKNGVIAILDNASKLFEENKFLESEIFLKRVLKLSPEKSKIFELLFKIALINNKLNPAIDIFNSNRQIINKSETALEKAAQLYIAKGELDTALKLLTDAIKIYPEDTSLNKLHLNTAIKAAKFELFPFEDFKLDPESPMRKPGKIYFHITVAVWGKEFTSFFINTSLPTQLGPENISALNSDSRSMYMIYTTPEDADVIKKSPVFQELVKEIDVRIYTIQGFGANNDQRHMFMTATHKHALRIAHENNARFIFWAPDAINSDSAFKNIFLKTKQGYKAILSATGLVMKKDEFKQYIIENFTGADIKTPIKAQDLVSLTMKIMHPQTELIFADNGKFATPPTLTAWKVKDEGFIIHGFHLHPWMIYPSGLKDFNDTLDGGGIQALCPNFDDIYISQDSDEIYGCSVDDKNHVRFNEMDEFNEQVLINWADINAIDYHKRQFAYELRYHATPETERSNEWAVVSQKTSKIAESVLNKVSFLCNQRHKSIFPSIISEKALKHSPQILDCVQYIVTSKINLTNLKYVCHFIQKNNVKGLELVFQNQKQIMEPWFEIVYPLLEQGVELKGTSKFNTQLNENELKLLSQFKALKIIDNDLKNEWKKNLGKIRQQSMTGGWSQPEIQLTHELNIRTVSTISSAIQNAFDSRIWKVVYTETGINGKSPENSLFSLQKHIFYTATEKIESALRLSEKLGINTTFSPHNLWTSLIQNKLAVEIAEDLFETRPELAIQAPSAHPTENTYSFSSPSQAGITTKECLRPWQTLRLESSGNNSICEI